MMTKPNILDSGRQDGSYPQWVQELYDDIIRSLNPDNQTQLNTLISVVYRVGYVDGFEDIF